MSPRDLDGARKVRDTRPDAHDDAHTVVRIRPGALARRNVKAPRRAPPSPRPDPQKHQGSIRGDTSSGSSSWAGPPHSPSEVYIARVPLVGLEALEWGLGNKYPGELDPHHVLVRHLECETDANGTENCTDWNAVTCYDFLPRSPRRPPPPPRCSAGSVKGKLRTRTLRAEYPSASASSSSGCVVGQRLGDGVDCQREIDARCAEFQKDWDPHLSLRTTAAGALRRVGEHAHGQGRSRRRRSGRT